MVPKFEGHKWVREFLRIKCRSTRTAAGGTQHSALQHMTDDHIPATNSKKETTSIAQSSAIRAS